MIEHSGPWKSLRNYARPMWILCWNSVSSMRRFRITAGRSTFLAQARQLSPKRTDVLLALGRASEDAGFYGDSVMAYDEYLQIRPDEDTVRRDRARSLRIHRLIVRKKASRNLNSTYRSTLRIRSGIIIWPN